MASSAQKPSSSSTSIPKYNFEVFLSFRGEDTRNNFTDHLFVNLGRMGINTFRDDQLERGEEIKSELLKTIEESRISIVVFSKNYAHSKWCLDELAKIMECREEMEQIVLPVFYHVDPSDVRKQTGSFGEAFSIHERNVDAKRVQRWKDSLTEACNLSGFHVNDGYESKHIKEISDEICKRLNPKLLHNDDNIVGIDSGLKELKSLLSNHSNDVRAIGIYGTGGIGKTTIAKIVYNQIKCQFNGASFLQDVRETFKKGCQLQLQKQLLRGIMGQDVEFSDINEGTNIIKGRLRSKKVLIVIDDVDHLNQLKSLAGSLEWLGPGSRIIITTRDQHLLHQYGVNESYKAKMLCGKDALQLFSRHAFKQDVPEEDYVDLSNCMVRYAQGLPLALKVLGSYLHGRTIDVWKSALNKFKKNSEKEINDVLKISFDGLDYCEREVFLDIACFFKGEDKDVVLRILDGCNLSATCGITVLCDRCLVTISYKNVIQMHDLIQQMGWAIVREEHSGHKWSRLWDVDDIYDAFSSKEVMKNIQTISLDLSKSKEIEFSAEVFAKMKKLRLLKIYCNDHDGLTREEDKVLFLEDFEFPPNLRYLHWERCPLRSLPSNFNGQRLIEINLKSSNLKQLWEGDKSLGELKGIDLSNSKQLVKMPNFSSMPNLERLNLEGCTSLRELHSSISDLKSLTDLNLRGCQNLLEFPVISGHMENLKKLYLNETSIKGLPSSIEYLECLEILDLSDCSKFEEFPEIRGNMKCLKELVLKGTAIKELPNSIGSLTSLEILSLKKCSKFERFSDIFTNMGLLWKLNLSESGVKELPNSIGSLTSLEILSLKKCSKFERFSNTFTNMGLLGKLNLSESGVKELPGSIGSLTSLDILSLKKCSKFERFSNTFTNMGLLRVLNLSESGIKELPGSIGYLESLKILDLSFCSNFEKFSEIQGNIECLKKLSLERALETLSLDGCSNFEELPEIRNNMSLCWLDLCETAIKELPCWISHRTQLYHLNLGGCRNLRTLKICGLKSLDELHLDNCSSLEAFLEIKEDMEHLKELNLSESNITELPSSIEHFRGLNELQLCRCEKLVSLPNSIGNLTCLTRICACHCPKLHNLPDDLRSLHCCLTHLELGGCNLMEGEIPSDLWCLSSLKFLDLSESHILRVPAGIIQLSQLDTLLVNHCPMLEEIGELPSSLTEMGAHGCPRLETETSSSPLWSSLLKHFKRFKSPIQRRFRIVVPGSSGIPKWVSHQRKGCEVEIELPIPKWGGAQRMVYEVEIELPKNWYEDNNLLGFVLFSHHVPLDDDECKTIVSLSPCCALMISHGDQSERLDFMCLAPQCKQWLVNCSLYDDCYVRCNGGTSDPAMWVVYFPQIDIPLKYRSRRWNTFKARFDFPSGGGSFRCGDNTCFKLESCGIHLLYAQDPDPLPSAVKRSLGDIGNHPAKRLKIL